jgi:transposase InsO family protein
MSGRKTSFKTAPMMERYCLIDEYVRDCLAICVQRRLNSQIMEEVLFELFLHQGPLEHIRSDNGPEFIATALKDWLGRIGVKTLYVTPALP